MSTLTHTYTRTHNSINFADPYKMCGQCFAWVDGVLETPGPMIVVPLIVVPCEHQGDYRDVCPSWSPVGGCRCAGYSAAHPNDPIAPHPMRQPADDGKVY